MENRTIAEQQTERVWLPALWLSADRISQRVLMANAPAEETRPVEQD